MALASASAIRPITSRKYHVQPTIPIRYASELVIFIVLKLCPEKVSLCLPLSLLVYKGIGPYAFKRHFPPLLSPSTVPHSSVLRVTVLPTRQTASLVAPPIPFLVTMPLRPYFGPA